MYSVQPYLVETVSQRSRCFQTDVERLAERYSLRLEGGYPASELQAQPHFQALLEYTLWGENSLVAVIAKMPYLRDRKEWPEPFPVTM
ncbi:hypothetical protein MXD63_43380, partial [Frankia sp. Cpl3]|nr:hypothetical protein [Frankia sp. Cpl3]